MCVLSVCVCVPVSLTACVCVVLCAACCNLCSCFALLQPLLGRMKKKKKKKKKITHVWVWSDCGLSQHHHYALGKYTGKKQIAHMLVN